MLPTNGAESPVQFLETELEKHAEEEPTWFDANALANYWRDELCSPSEVGWVRSEMYEEAVKRNAALRAKVFDEADPADTGRKGQS